MDRQTPDVISLQPVEQLRRAQKIIRQEAAALESVADQLTVDFSEAVQLVADCRGSVIVTGVGKAGLIGRKIVATLASTGTRSHFLHPTEAVHGDLGCVGPDDVVLALSNSGRSSEVLALLPILKRFHVPLISITRDNTNPLAQAADHVLTIGRYKEADSLNLAPSVSTTAMLAVGDALAFVVSHAKGFTANGFATFHPAGSLGQQLRTIKEVMRSGDDFRSASATSTVRNVMIELSRPGRRTGAVVLTNEPGRIVGIFTDSDLARLFEQRREHAVDGPISDVMTVNPTTIAETDPLTEAVQLMSDRKISELPVVDSTGRPVGLIDITDVLDLVAAVEQQTESVRKAVA